jgi:hypothetical protein
MGDPASPEGPKKLETDASMGTPAAPAVSIPDRRRIDSDVRAFLREPSTPWIVFDQEGRPPSQLAVGEILRGPRRTLLSDYDFSATAAVDFGSAHGHAAPRISEPSALFVASKVRAAAALPAPASLDADVTAEGLVAEPSEMVGPMFGPRFGVRRQVLGASAAAFALLSLLVVGTFAIHASSSSDTKAMANAANAVNAAAAQPVGAPAEAPAIDLAPQPAVAPPPVLATSALAASVALTMIAPHPDAATKSGGGKYGRLTIAGDARAKDVFMDGKRMLGRGQRTFSVMCGMHTIAVNVRSDAHEVEIPCNAELVVGK